MDALAKLFSIFGSTELMQTGVSILAATAVFFYFIYLLRKEEVAGQAGEESSGEEMSAEMRRHA